MSITSEQASKLLELVKEHSLSTREVCNADFMSEEHWKALHNFASVDMRVKNYIESLTDSATVK